MAGAGCRLLANPVARSAMLLGALAGVRYWWGLLGEIRRELRALRPAVVVPIDSSAVNLRVARIARGEGIPVCYYVAPQLWASRPWRMGTVRAVTDTLCCVLPFEEGYFGKHGVHAVYVGHPMFDSEAEGEETDPLRLEPALPGVRAGEAAPVDAPRVGVFPGSRAGEIAANLPPMLEVLSEVKGRFARASFVAVAPSEERAWQVRHHLRRTNTTMDIRVGCTDAVVRWADLCLTKSGTATLQIARHHKPMVVLYAVAGWKWHLAGKYLINTQYIALVNILANREVVPEYVPFYGSPLPVAREVIELLAKPELRAAMGRDLAELVKPLMPRGKLAAERVAEEVGKLMGKGRVERAPTEGRRP